MVTFLGAGTRRCQGWLGATVWLTRHSDHSWDPGGADRDVAHPALLPFPAQFSRMWPSPR